MNLDDFPQIWLVDFEFSVPPGERPHPICLVAQEFRSGRIIRTWEDELHQLSGSPFSLGSDSLYVAYYSPSEFGCHLSLGWDLPKFVLDLYAEFRNLTNGIPTLCGNGLLGALTYFGLKSIDVAEKEEMRKLALRGGPWSGSEQRTLLGYCESDVNALQKLFPRIERHLDVPRALIRGRYMKAAARMEHTGIPIDVHSFSSLQRLWPTIQKVLIKEVDASFGVYEGQTFKRKRFEQWLEQKEIPWPRHPTGILKLDDDTFKEMTGLFPQLKPLRQLRSVLSQMRLMNMAIGADGRNRTMLSAFRARTGRNQPKNSKFIFGAPTWLRGIIKPEQGSGLAYIDWSQQEFGIAAALSGDTAMIEDYQTGDPYLAFAKQAEAVPPEATKQSHPGEREQFKTCSLAVLYGRGAAGLASAIGRSEAFARELLNQHQRTYPHFCRWSQAAIDTVMSRKEGRLWTTFGWTVYGGSDPNPRFLCNFPMQANGAEMLRLACCFATEEEIRVCAPIHDALLIEAPLGELDQTIQTTREAMDKASSIVLDGFILRTDVKVIRYPDRFIDERGKQMWDLIWKIVDNLEE